jgi:cyclopropane fatty-acyl-phospholipid synthase-like methyltransferase
VNNIKVAPELYDELYYTNSGGGKYSFHEQIKTIYNKAIEKANLKNNMLILDLGCGRGDLLKIIADKYPDIVATGADYSKTGVRIAETNLSSYPNINIIQANGINLPFKKETFDRVFCLDYVEHLSQTDLNKSLRCVYEILKPNGILIIHTFPTKYINDTIHSIFRLIGLSSIGQKGHINCQSYFSIKKTLNKLGYNSRIKLVNRDNLISENLAWQSKLLPLLDILYYQIGRLFGWIGLKYLIYSDIWVIAKKE